MSGGAGIGPEKRPACLCSAAERWPPPVLSVPFPRPPQPQARRGAARTDARPPSACVSLLTCQRAGIEIKLRIRTRKLPSFPCQASSCCFKNNPRLNLCWWDEQKWRTEIGKCAFLTIPDVEEDIRLLTEYRSDITGRHDGVVHLVPEAVASLQQSQRERVQTRLGTRGPSPEKCKENGMSHFNCKSLTFPPRMPAILQCIVKS